MEHTGNYYLISHLVLITGLSDRTIRNYISSGILQGEKNKWVMALYGGTGRFICAPSGGPPKYFSEE